MRSRFLGTLALLVAATAFVGCAKPWYGFDWLSPAPQEEAPGSDEEYMSKFRHPEGEGGATGASDRSREIESRLGFE